MKLLRLFQKTLFGIVALFFLVGISTSLVCITAVDSQLTREYETNSKGIAKSIADASVDILLNRDLSSLQSLIDQYLEIQGISYIYITNEHGEYLAHTFVPYIPNEISASDHDETEFIERNIKGQGDFMEVSSPILAGVAGKVHIGMNRSVVSLKIQSAIGQQIGAMAVIFFLGIFAVIIFINFAARPIDRLLGFAVDLAKGEQADDPKTQALLVRRDESGDLARLFEYFFKVRDPEKSGITPAK